MDQAVLCVIYPGQITILLVGGHLSCMYLCSHMLDVHEIYAKKNRVPCAWFRLPSAGVLALMRVALRPRASCGDRRCCCRNAPGTGRFAGEAQYLWFGWLLQALCFALFLLCIYRKFFGFRRDDGGFQKIKKKTLHHALAWPNRSGCRSYEAKILSSSLSASIFVKSVRTSPSSGSRAVHMSADDGFWVYSSGDVCNPRGRFAA